MKRTIPTIVTLLAVVIARASDIASTLHFNPSLSREANPLVRLVGVQTGGRVGVMVLSNVVFVILAVVWPLWFYWRYPAAALPLQPKNVREFASLQLFNRILPHGEFLRFCFLGVPFPKNRMQLARCFGFVISWTIVFGSFLAAFSWWARHAWHWHAYERYRASFAIGNYPVMELLPCFPVAFLAAVVFFRMEYAGLKTQPSE